MDQYVMLLIQQKSKPYLKHVRFVNLVEQIGMDSVNFYLEMDNIFE